MIQELRCDEAGDQLPGEVSQAGSGGRRGDFSAQPQHSGGWSIHTLRCELHASFFCTDLSHRCRHHHDSQMTNCEVSNYLHKLNFRFCLS